MVLDMVVLVDAVVVVGGHLLNVIVAIPLLCMENQIVQRWKKVIKSLCHSQHLTY
jgi:hypothetical protein